MSQEELLDGYVLQCKQESLLSKVNSHRSRYALYRQTTTGVDGMISITLVSSNAGSDGLSCCHSRKVIPN